MSGGAWPFLVGGVTCLVNSVNERDLRLPSRYSSGLSWFIRSPFTGGADRHGIRSSGIRGVGALSSSFWKGGEPAISNPGFWRAYSGRGDLRPGGGTSQRDCADGFLKREEVGGNNRSVMPLDVPGRTRATMTGINGLPGRFSVKHVPEFLGIPERGCSSWVVWPG